jgi:hypothetical protein
MANQNEFTDQDFENYLIETYGEFRSIYRLYMADKINKFIIITEKFDREKIATFSKCVLAKMPGLHFYKFLLSGASWRTFIVYKGQIGWEYPRPNGTIIEYYA